MSQHSTSKDNIVRHNISYNFAFGSNSLSFIFSRYSRFCYFDHFFGHISGSTGPILLTSKTILSATKFPIIFFSFLIFLYLSYFSRFSQKTYQTRQFEYFQTRTKYTGLIGLPLSCNISICDVSYGIFIDIWPNRPNRYVITITQVNLHRSG